MNEQLCGRQLEARQVYQLIKTGELLHSGILNLLAKAPLRVSQLFLIEQNLGEAKYRGQRRAQLVRHSGEEQGPVMRDMAQLPIRFFQRYRPLLQLLDQLRHALVVRRSAVGLFSSVAVFSDMTGWIVASKLYCSASSRTSIVSVNA